MLSYIQRYFSIIQLLLAGLLGVALGQLAAAGMGLYLNPSVQTSSRTAQVTAAPVKRLQPSDYQAILKRDIFDSAAPNVASLPVTATASAPQQQSNPAAPPVNLTLLGTVTAGKHSLAIIENGRKVKIYHLGDQVPGGAEVHEVARTSVTLRSADGTLSTLPLFQGKKGSAAGPSPTRTSRPASTRTASLGGGIRAVGPNRWIVPQQAVDKARANMNDLLRQARMEPLIVNGQTEGFVVRMIRPRSLLALLGLQVGDVVKQVNGVQLDSPEKALQIFQQLREARHFTISLVRGGKQMNLEYDVE